MAFTLRLDDDARDELRRLAEAEGVSQQKAVRRATRDRRERWALHATVTEAAARGASRYAELLDRGRAGAGEGRLDVPDVASRISAWR